MEQAPETGFEKAPHPHLNEVIQEWYQQHAEQYPNGAQIKIDITPDSGATISIQENEPSE